MKKFIIIMLAIVAITATAQDRNKWAKEMLETKHKMLIEQVGLDKAQQEEFMPLYEAMEKEIYQTNREARTLAATVSKKANATDAEYLQAAEAMSKAKVREGEIEAAYFAKFTKILSKKQLFLLKQAEANFTRTLLQKRNNK